MTQYSVLGTQGSAVARTPLYHWHSAHGARFTDSQGWQLPAVYTTAEQEVSGARSAVGLADISAFAKISLIGDGIPTCCRRLAGDGHLGNPGRVVLIDAAGPALACRLTEDQLLLLAASTDPSRLNAYLASQPTQQSVVRRDVTSAYAGFAVVGPETDELLRRVTALDVLAAALPAGSCAETSLAGVHATLVRAPDISLPSIRIYVAWDLAEYAWESLLSAGRSVKLTPLGLEAWQRLMNEQGNWCNSSSE